jgi:hypothetical protein
MKKVQLFKRNLASIESNELSSKLAIKKINVRRCNVTYNKSAKSFARVLQHF